MAATWLRVALLALATLLPAVDASAWWDKGWSHRRKLTFDNSGQPENLGNFPVLVVLDPSRIDYSKTRAGGIDIRFVDSNDQTLLSHEIERWTPGGTSYVWVRVPQVDASSNTDFMWMYYGNPTAPNAENIPFVWSPGFVMVHHLNETVSDGNHLDSATLDGANDASAILVQAQGTATGMIDGADSLVRPSNHRIDVPDSPSLDMAAGDSFTVEAWGRTNFSASYQMAFSKESRCGDPDPPPTACPDGDGEIQLWTAAGGSASFWLNDGAGNTARAGSAANIADDQWHYLVGRWNEAAGLAEIFVDGVNVSTGGGQTPGTLGAIATATPAVIGDEGDNSGGGGVGGAAWAGLLDEIRVSKALRSDNWIRAQNKAMRDNAFVLYGAEAAHCCGLTIGETATTITVNAQSRFEIGFNTATGGGIDQFYDDEEDPGVDLAGGNSSPGLQPALFSDEVALGANRTTAANTQGARMYLLEATPARVKVRQDAFYQHQSDGTITGALKGYGDYSIYGIGRLALGWERRAAAAIAAPSHTQLQWTVRYTGVAPLQAWNGSSQNYGPIVSPWGWGGGAGTAADDFVLAQSEQPDARTDFLSILSQDWASANEIFFGERVTENWQEVSWFDNPSAPISVGSERFNFLTYFKPTTLASGGDTAVTSRSADYRGPDSLSITLGNPWNDPAQLTGGDHFNEAEAAYLLTLDPNPGQGLTFQIDGTAGTPRYSPFFKIRQWRSFQETPVVRLNGSLLTKNVNFRSAVKPLSRAHWASTLNWHCTMESTSACDSGNLDVGSGTGGSTSGTVTVQPGRYGNGLVFNENTDSVTAASSDFNRNVGAVDFWYQPFYNHNDGFAYVMWYQKSGSNPYDCYYFGKLATNDLIFGVVVGATNSTCTIGGTTYSATASAASYSWRAYDWVHLKTSWNSSGLAGPRKLRIVMNGVEIASSGTFVAPPTSSTPIFGGCSLNCPATPGGNANGIIDEPHIYGGLELNAYDTNSPFAHAGLASDAGEYLADTTKNWSLALTPVVGGSSGSYLYFGADSPFRGLNVALQTPGVWTTTPGDLVWEFWNGTQWATLESGYGFTDQTLDFTRNGTIYWTGDPFNWSPYSVNGGPDLYYIRLHLAGGVLTYATQPMERQIKTDILLFQYCQDIVTPAQAFAFAVPWATTEVRLESFAASPGDASVLLEWRTGSELDNLGFHLHRSLSGDGPWTRLTPSLIPGLGSSATGQGYSFRDQGLVNGTRYFYRLEDVDASSKSTFHGPVSAVPSPSAPAGGGGTGDDAGARGKKKHATASSCPDWVLSAYGSATGASVSTVALACSRHGDPEAVSLSVVSRDARQATLELRTGGFYALHEPSGSVRAFVPGFDFPQDEQAAALPIRRALADAVVGRRVQLGGVRALELQSFRGLVPSALGKAQMQVGRDGTVRAARRASARAPRQFPKQELVTLLPSVFQGDLKSAVVQIAPLRFDDRRQQLVLAKRVRVKLLFTGREAGESGRGSQGRAPGSRKTALSGEVLARLFTTTRGLHAVSFEQLFPGRQRGVAASQLRLERQGEAVAFHVEPSADSFGPGSRFFFFTDRTAASTDFASEVAFELVESRDGQRMALSSAAPSGGPIGPPSTGFAFFETNRFYQPGLLDAPDPWLWEALASGATRATSFSLAFVSGSGTAGLDVDLQGASESGEPIDHHVSVSLNGTPVGDARFAGKRPYRISLTVPASLLREGANELSLTNVADTGVSSLVFLDRFSIARPQLAALSAGAFEGTWSEGGTASLAGVSADVSVLDVGSATGAPRWLTGYEVSGGSVRFRAEAGRRYWVGLSSALFSPRVATVQPSTLKSAGNQADYVLIAPRAFLAAAEPLVERRQDQGLSTRAVAFEEIADEFGHGQASAEAIRSFLAHAYQAWARPSPRYVLLLGDASYDPRNFMGTSGPSPLPALWTKTSYLWTVSDPLLAAVNGEDALPDLAIGRLPATTLEQAELLVAKLIAWEDSGQGLSGPAALVADNPDEAGDFETDVRDIAASYLSHKNPELLLLSELGAAMRPSILDALNSGLSYLSYVGHGGAAVWASENVWNSWDAPSLQAQSQQPLLLTMNCLNGYFVAPAFESLSESLMKAEGRGAIAAFSPSGLSLDGPAHQYHRALMAALTSGQHERLGDAILAAQRTHAATGLMPELLGIYHLLGDPATRIR